MVCVVDWAVGQVNSLLDELGLARETLLIVTSDNGADLADYDGDTHDHKANGGWRGQKADVFEGGHREPFVARWPGHIPPGSVTNELFCLMDLLPTIARATGAVVPENAAEDAVDVLDVLTGKCASPRRSLVHHSLNATFSLRWNNWKLVMGSGSGGFSGPVGQPCSASSCDGQLYDIVVDPGETLNLWGERQDIVRMLYNELKEVARGPASGLSFDVLSSGEEERQPAVVPG
jgi:arylsulfatase A-like enzyme